MISQKFSTRPKFQVPQELQLLPVNLYTTPDNKWKGKRSLNQKTLRVFLGGGGGVENNLKFITNQHTFERFP